MVARPPCGIAIQTKDPHLVLLQPQSFRLTHCQWYHPLVQSLNHRLQRCHHLHLSIGQADNAASLPTQILPSTLPPQDLSGLCSSKPNPFSSLQHCSRCFVHSHQSCHCHSRFNFNYFYPSHHNLYKPSQPHLHTKTHLSSTGNPTPGFLFSAVLLGHWDGSALPDTTFLSFFSSFMLCLMCQFCSDTPLFFSFTFLVFITLFCLVFFCAQAMQTSPKGGVQMEQWAWPPSHVTWLIGSVAAVL